MYFCQMLHRILEYYFLDSETCTKPSANSVVDKLTYQM
jgi:hypothetical protein